MNKLVINPAYRVIEGRPKCNHRREKFKFVDGLVYGYCDECMVVYVYWEDDSDVKQADSDM